MNTAPPEPKPFCPICTRPRDATPDSMLIAGLMIGIIAKGDAKRILQSFCAHHSAEIVNRIKASNARLAMLLGIR